LKKLTLDLVHKAERTAPFKKRLLLKKQSHLQRNQNWMVISVTFSLNHSW